MNSFQINALLTETGVNMGDHAQDVTNAIEVDPDMTVGELCRQVLTKIPWTWPGAESPPETKLVADGSKYLTVRLAVKP